MTELATAMIPFRRVNRHVNAARVRLEFDPRKAFVGGWYNNVPDIHLGETWHHFWIAFFPMLAIHIDWHRWDLPA